MMVDLKFSDMDRWPLSRLRKAKKELIDKVSTEIHKRNSLKAEILFYQKELAKYETDEF